MGALKNVEKEEKEEKKEKKAVKEVASSTTKAPVKKPEEPKKDAAGQPAKVVPPALPADTDGSGVSGKIDQFFSWLKTHFSGSEGVFKGDKEKISTKIKGVNEKLINLAGKSDDASKEKRLDLQEELMDLQHRDRMR